MLALEALAVMLLWLAIVYNYNISWVLVIQICLISTGRIGTQESLILDRMI